MANTISRNLRLSVRAGRLDADRELVAEMIETEGGESGSVGYEWFPSDDGAVCHTQDRFVDSETAPVHLGNYGETLAERFLGCFEPTGLFVTGEPSAEARSALAGLGAVYLGAFGGFTRSPDFRARPHDRCGPMEHR